jgi:hypothetical protein
LPTTREVRVRLQTTHGILHAQEQQHSREEIYQRYIDVFSKFPENQTEVVHRVAFGQFIIDHERVRRSPSAEPFDVVAIYELEQGLIKRLDFVRS